MEGQVDFQQEMNDMLVNVEEGLRQEVACDQAVRANAMLVLMGNLDFSKLESTEQIDCAYDVFRMSCYALGSYLAVLRVLAAAYGMTQAHALEAVIRALGLLFKFDPASQIEVMLNESPSKAEEHSDV